MTTRITALPLLAIAVTMAFPAHAQEAVQPADDEIVVTAQRDNASVVANGGSAGVLGDKAAEDLPFQIRSFGEELILNQQPQTLGEVLENDPTIRTTYGFGNAAEQFVIRGFTLFADDIGLNGLYGIAPRQLVAPELFDSVQVLNGASAFLNGAAPGGSGLGGSVNLVLKRAGNEPTSRVTAGYNSEANFGGSVDVARRFGNANAWGLRLNGAWRDGEIAIDREDRRTRVLGGAIDYNGGNLRAALDIAYQEIRVDNLRPKITIGTNAIPAVPEAQANYAQAFTFTELRDVFGTLSLEYDLADNALLYAKAGARDGSEEGIYGGVTLLDAATGDGNGTVLFVPRTDNNQAVEAGVRVKLGSAITHEFNFGGNASWQVNRNAFDFLGGFGGYATNIYDTPQVPQPGTGFVGGDLDDPFPITRTQLYSAFASDTVGLFGDRLLVTGGLRLQNIEVLGYASSVGVNPDGSAFEMGDLTSRYDENAVTPVVGIVAKPFDGLSLYANRIEALQQGPIAPLNPILTNPGEIFAPFRTVQYEVGGKARFGALFASLAFYRIELPIAGATLVDPNDPAGPQTFGVGGEQRNQGIEFSMNGDLAPGLRLIAGAAYTDARLIRTETGVNESNRVKGVPEWTGNAGVEWDLPFLAGATLTARAIHTGGQQVDVANSLQIDDWTVGNLGGRYVFAAGETPITLRLTVDNVTNERYWASAFDSFNAALLQGRPRTVRASLSADF